MSVSVLPARAAASNPNPDEGFAGRDQPPPPTSTPIPMTPIVAVKENDTAPAKDLAENRPVRNKRHYSSSESECLQPSTSSSSSTVNPVNLSFNESRKRNYNHNHHHKQRSKKRKLFNSPDACGSNGGGGKANNKKQLPRVPLTQQPKAPNNTTQFLITDREERESSDRDTTADVSSSFDFSQLRPRCFSSACHNPNSSSLEASSLLLNSSDSEDEEQEEDSEFSAVYDNVSLERIQGLPRDKVNREMLTTQKCNSVLVDRVTHLKSENHRLKNILLQHGIEFAKSAAHDPPLFDPSILFNQSLSRSSVESEGNDQASKQNDDQEDQEARNAQRSTSPSKEEEQER